MQTVSITVKGRVQGVFYRQSTKETGTELGITGKVKNLSNGDVHIVATGTEEQLQKLIEWCKRGPDRAVVTDVVVQKVPLQTFDRFRVVR
jgi:acylphosphatase